MKTYLSLASALLLISTSLVEANTIVYGDFWGVVTSSSWPFPGKIGDPVSGTFRYDADRLYGSGQTSPSDPSLRLDVDVNGTGFMAWAASPNGLGFTVNSAGIPLYGSAAGSFDVFIGPGTLGFVAGGRGSVAQVTFQVTGIPDSGTTAFLTGLGWASLMVARRVAVRRDTNY